MSRTKSAIIIFVFIAAGIIVALNVDYTDTYVTDRFQEALDSGRYDDNQPFSLDAFMEFYDWDRVCVALPGVPNDFKTRGRLPYKLKWNDKGHWALILIKDYYVVAEIPFDRSHLEPPEDAEGLCLERWKAILKIVDSGGVPQLRFVGQ